MRMLRWSHLAATFCPFYSKRLLILIQVQSILFLLCDISWLCIVSFGVQTKATVSRSHSSAVVSRPTLPECGHLYNHASLCSLVQQRTEKPWFMAVCPDFKSTGSSQSFTANFSSLSCPSFFHPMFLIFCYCSSLDFIKVDFLQSIISVVCECIHHYYSCSFLGSGISANPWS